MIKKIVFYFVLCTGAVFTNATAAGEKVFPMHSSTVAKHITRQLVPFRPAGIVRWEETFNSSTQPANWRVIDHDSSGSSWTYRQLIVFTSGDSVRPEIDSSFWFASFLGADSAGHIDEYLTSPRIPLVVGPYDSLHFYAGAVDQGYNDSLRVFVSTTDSALSSFTTQIAYFKVDGVIDSTGSIWHRYSMSLAQFMGDSIFIAVNYYIVDGGPTGNNSDNVWVDHFSVESYPPAYVADKDPIPFAYSVSRNYPNPFNPSTTINFQAQKDGIVKLIVYDLLGQEVRTLVDGSFQAGAYSVVWDARDDDGSSVASGVYIYRFEAEGFVSVQRMVLLK
jgi:FlgD Ig-like domain/Cleaved Adhesin Domain